jgi:hypothetical protein
MGLCFYYLDDFESALECFKTSLELKPDFGEARIWWDKVATRAGMAGGRAGAGMAAGAAASATAHGGGAPGSVDPNGFVAQEDGGEVDADGAAVGISGVERAGGHGASPGGGAGGSGADQVDAYGDDEEDSDEDESDAD